MTFRLKANELLYTPHSFTSREFALFTYTRICRSVVLRQALYLKIEIHITNE